jgi:ankyrin repeat protein
MKDADVLLEAAEKGDLNTVENLLATGVDINTKNSFAETPLFLASRHGCLEVVLFLLDHNADVHVLNTGKQSALHAACIGGHAAVVEKLITAGADPMQQTLSRKKPLSFALKYGHLDVIKYFVSHNLLENKDLGELVFCDRHARAKPEQIFEMIFSHYQLTDEKTIDDVFGNLIASHVLIGMKYMLSKFPTLKTRLSNQFNLLLASFELGEENVKIFQVGKIKSKVLRKREHQIWEHQAKNTSLKFLLTRGLALETRDSEGQTILHRAAAYEFDEYEHISHLKGLLDMKYPIDLLNAHGQTPLHVALQQAMFFHAIYLVYRGADITRSDQEGRTVMDYAKAFCPTYYQPDDPENLEFKNDLIQLLEDYGAIK